MTGKAIIGSLLKLVHTEYQLNIPEFDLQIDNELISLEEAFQLFNGRPEVMPIQQFIASFTPDKLGDQYLEDEYVNATRLEFIDFTTNDFSKRKRSFGFSDAQFGYVSLSQLRTVLSVVPIDTTGEDFKTFIDFVSTLIAINDAPRVIQLLGYFANNNDNIGLLVHKFQHTHNSLSVYSYIYYKDLLGGNQLELDPQLKYSSPHGATVNFTNGVVYEQYFELFDIINELNHSTDIISRFLKLYHILEYLVYRVELVEIEKKARVNRSFIREIHGFTGKTQSDKELEVLKRNFRRIFSTELAGNTFQLTLSQDQITFINNHFSLSTYVHTDHASVSTLIYKIRNSIVHNKESEFHLTSTNPDDYAIIIPVVKDLIQKLERAIFDKISNNAVEIRYQSASIQLY